MSSRWSRVRLRGNSGDVRYVAECEDYTSFKMPCRSWKGVGMRFSTVLVFLILSMIGCTVDQTIATEAPDDPIGLDHPWRAFKGCYVACQLPTESGIVKATDGWSIWRQNMTTSERSPAVKLEGPLPKSVFVNHVFSLDGSWLARTDGSEVTIYHGESGKRFYSGSPIGPSGIPVRLPDSAYDSSWQRGGFYPVYLAFVADRTLLAANSRGYDSDFHVVRHVRERLYSVGPCLAAQ
jgi:hypothetical protein